MANVLKPEINFDREVRQILLDILVVLYTLKMKLESVLGLCFVSCILAVNLDDYDFEYYDSEFDNEDLDFDYNDMSPPLKSTPSPQGSVPDLLSPSIAGNLESHSYLLGFNVLLQVLLRRKARRMLSIYSMMNSKMFPDLQAFLFSQRSVTPF